MCVSCDYVELDADNRPLSAWTQGWLGCLETWTPSDVVVVVDSIRCRIWSLDGAHRAVRIPGQPDAPSGRTVDVIWWRNGQHKYGWCGNGLG